MVRRHSKFLVNLPTELKRALRAHAKKEKMSMAEVIRRAIRRELGVVGAPIIQEDCSDH